MLFLDTLSLFQKFLIIISFRKSLAFPDIKIFLFLLYYFISKSIFDRTLLTIRLLSSVQDDYFSEIKFINNLFLNVFY